MRISEPLNSFQVDGYSLVTEHTRFNIRYQQSLTYVWVKNQKLLSADVTLATASLQPSKKRGSILPRT